MKLWLGFLFAAIIIAQVEGEYKRVCYYTNWARYRPGPWSFLPGDIDFTLCTHVIYSFAQVLNGVLAPYGETDDLNSLVSLSANTNTKILLAVGGWNHGPMPFSKMADTSETRMKFIKHAIDYLRQYKLDGLDLDWEYPACRGSPLTDKTKFTALVTELRAAFENEAQTSLRPRLLLTAAVAAGSKTIDAAYEVSKINDALDFINLMSYDLHGAWDGYTGLNSPLHGRSGEPADQATLNQEWAVDRWLALGATKEKLVLGMALYGRTYRICPEELSLGLGAKTCGPANGGRYTQESGFLSYYEIRELQINAGWARVYDSQHMAPYAYSGRSWVGYDDVESVKAKCEYLVSKKLAGAMVWALDLDDFRGDYSQCVKYPLLRTITQVLTGVPPPKPGCQNTPKPTTEAPTATTTSKFTTLPPQTGVCPCLYDNYMFCDNRDKTTFYTCANGGTLAATKCPANLIFNTEKKYCDYPSNPVPDCYCLGVETSSTTSTTATTTAEPKTTTTAAPTTTTTTIPTTTAAPTTITTTSSTTTHATPAPIQPSTFKCPRLWEAGCFPVPNDCTRYYFCVFEEYAYELSCKEEHYFDKISRTCQRGKCP